MKIQTILAAAALTLIACGEEPQGQNSPEKESAQGILLGCRGMNPAQEEEFKLQVNDIEGILIREQVGNRTACMMARPEIQQIRRDRRTLGESGDPDACQEARKHLEALFQKRCWRIKRREHFPGMRVR